MYSDNPAHTSAMCENSFFSSAVSVFLGRTWSAGFAWDSGIGLIGVSLVSLGTMPFSIMRASTQVRYAS